MGGGGGYSFSWPKGGHAAGQGMVLNSTCPEQNI